MNGQSQPTRKPYTTPRVQEQGRVASVTQQTPTPTLTLTPAPSQLVNEFDEF